MLPLALTTLTELAAQERDGPRNYVFFGFDRSRIADARFLGADEIEGAQLKYSWRELEPVRNEYAFDQVRSDLAFLEGHGKRLFLQLQDVSFVEDRSNVPDYVMTDPEFGGGVAPQLEFEGEGDLHPSPIGLVARRWDPAVRSRITQLLRALGREFDGRIEGISLPETSIEFGTTGRFHPEGFSYEGYAEAVRLVLAAARAAFPTSKVLIYANFMPGEWLPWEDRGYLRGIYRYAEEIGAGVGGPDLLPHRAAQRNHSLALIAARRDGTPAGMAVQDGNLGALNPTTGEPVTVAELYGFARDTLHLNYLFWGTEEPYFSREILPFLRELARTTRGIAAPRP